MLLLILEFQFATQDTSPVGFSNCFVSSASWLINWLNYWLNLYASYLTIESNSGWLLH